MENNPKNKASEITGSTKLICLLGSPVSHSISPMMHNMAFKKLGLDYVYLAFDVGTEKLEDTVKAFRHMGVRGFNLTMPDKTEMFGLCDSCSKAAKMIGAVNTVVNENGVLVGHNTDGIGYFMAAEDAGFNVKGKTLTLLGAGGAATAIAVQAALNGVEKLYIFNRKSRTFAHGEEIVSSINNNTDCMAYIYDLADEEKLKDCLEESYLLINGTSIGMSPAENACPIPLNMRLPQTLAVSDIIYQPRQTLLLKMAEEQENPCFNGLYMLLYQGAEAFRLWTGRDMPVEDVKQKYFSVHNP